jgi:hypothetical protein
MIVIITLTWLLIEHREQFHILATVLVRRTQMVPGLTSDRFRNAFAASVTDFDPLALHESIPIAKHNQPFLLSSLNHFERQSFCGAW